MGCVGDTMWKGSCVQKTLKAELDAFVFFGVDPLSIKQEDVNLDGKQGSQNFIHSVSFKSKVQNAKKLVMIHGFGGGAAVFMRMIPYLQDYFEVIALDLLGMGSSGRPDLKINDFS